MKKLTCLLLALMMTVMMAFSVSAVGDEAAESAAVSVETLAEMVKEASAAETKEEAEAPVAETKKEAEVLVKETQTETESAVPENQEASVETEKTDTVKEKAGEPTAAAGESAESAGDDSTDEEKASDEAEVGNPTENDNGTQDNGAEKAAEEAETADDPANENVNGEEPAGDDVTAEESADGDAEDETTEEVPELPDTVDFGPKEVEVEDGVIHGRLDDDLIAKNDADPDYPVIFSFEIAEYAAILQVGDTVHFTAEISDGDGIESAWLFFGTSYSNYQNEQKVVLTLNKDSGLFEGRYTFVNSDKPGEYHALYLQAQDTKGFYTILHSEDGGVMKRLLPGSVEFAGEELLAKSDEESERPEQFVPQTYLLMTVGGTADVRLYDSDDEDIEEVAWRVTDTEGKAFASGAAVISVSNGTVTALKVGTAYVVADITRVVGTEASYDADGQVVETSVTEIETARCRIDVIANEGEKPIEAEIGQVTLADAKATVELFKTDYTKVTLVPETKDMTAKSTALAPVNQGWAITAAEFTGEGSELFSAVVTDDRTIAIVPTLSAIEKAQAKSSDVKKSYKFGLKLTMRDGSTFDAVNAKGDPTTLTLTVKQSKPTVKATALKFNSLVKNDFQPYNFSPNYWKLDPDAPTPPPEWLEIYRNGVLLLENAPSKASGTLYLKFGLDGWAIEASVKLKYSVSATYPKVTFDPKTVTLKAGNNGFKWVTAKVTPAVFAKASYVEDIWVTEGKTRYENDERLKITYDLYQGDGNLYFKVDASVYNDGKAHTYKVNVKLCGKTYSFTVKTPSAVPSVTVKQSNYIEGYVAYGRIDLYHTIKNHEGGGGTLYTAMGYYPAGSRTLQQVPFNLYNSTYNKYDVYSEDAWFEIVYNGQSYRAVYALKPLDRGTYFVGTSYKPSNGVESKQIATKLNIKWTDKEKVKPAKLSLTKATGSIDPVRPGTQVEYYIKDVFWYYALDDISEYKIIKKASGKKTTLTHDQEPFNILSSSYGGYSTIALSIKDGTVLESGATYSIQVKVSGSDFSSEVAIPIKMETVKLEQIDTLRLLLKDRNSSADFVLKPTDSTVSAIRKVELDAASAKLFDVRKIGNGTYSITYKDGVVATTLKSGNTKTVKLSIWFEGNVTTKPNVTTSIKVNIF